MPLLSSAFLVHSLYVLSQLRLLPDWRQNVSVAQSVLYMCFEGFIVHIMHARKMRLRCAAQRPKNSILRTDRKDERGRQRRVDLKLACGDPSSNPFLSV